MRKLSDSTTDEGFFASRIAFGDWRPYGPLGWGRVNTLQVHGESPSFGTTRLNLVTVVDGVTGLHSIRPNRGEFYVEHGLQYPKGSAYSFEIYDSLQTTPVTKGLVIHSLAYSASPPDGLRKLSNSERF